MICSARRASWKGGKVRTTHETAGSEDGACVYESELAHSNRVRAAMLPKMLVVVLALGILLTWGFMIAAGTPSRLWWWAVSVPFATWVAVPYAVVLAAGMRLRSAAPSLWVLLVVAALLSLSAAFLLYQVFVVHLDAQSGIVFVFLPGWQLLGIVPLLFLARFLHRRQVDA